jgi:hypothetical protein
MYAEPPMFFYVWNSISVTVSESAIVKFRCGRCEELYYFEGHVTATGFGHSPFMLDDDGATRRAKRKAKKAVRSVFEARAFPVPCPACGWYAREIFPVLRRKLYRWMFPLGVALVICSIPAYLLVALATTLASEGTPSDSPTTLLGVLCGAVCLLLGLASWSGQFLLRRLYDPNERIPQATRIARGQEMSVPSSDMPQPLPLIDQHGTFLARPVEDEIR